MSECKECIHLAVCGTYDATGGNVRNCKHFAVTMPKHLCQECCSDKLTLFDAFKDIVWYDGHYEWLKDLRDELFEHREERHYSMPRDIVWHTEVHTIWMLLVGMFGNWGTSIRGGWLEDLDGCIAFIDALCKEAWEHEEEEKDGK